MTAGHGALVAALAASLDRAVAAAPSSRIGGDGRRAIARWETAAGPVLVKWLPRSAAAELEAERRSLEALAAAGAIRVPQVLGAGSAGSDAFLALEWLELLPASDAADAALGAALAALHRVVADRFGFETDNFIGRTPQRNAWCADWPQFLASRRLRPQLELAAENGYGDPLLARGARLAGLIDVFYRDYRPVPSLLHGDLWAGNRGVLAGGTPVVFDPAVYYGDREADVAMTRLFGGFGAGFYAAYAAAWPPDPGAPARVALHQLYHMLNHLNLFGGGYQRQALGLIDRLLAAAGH